MSAHYSDGRRWSHISNAWILLESWNDREEIASLNARIESLAAIEPASGVLMVQEGDTVPFVHPQYGPGIFFTEDALIAAPQAPITSESDKQVKEPRFPNVFCSQCGRDFGPGEHGFSHCRNHAGKASGSAA